MGTMVRELGSYARQPFVDSRDDTGMRDLERGLNLRFGCRSVMRRWLRNEWRRKRMLDETEKEKLRTLTVEHVLDVRAAYLKTAAANPLKHWDVIQARLRAAAKTSSSVEEWSTDMVRSLRLEAPSVSFSQSVRSLADYVRERKAAREFLQLVDDEYGYVMAMARSIAEQRKEAKNV